MTLQHAELSYPIWRALIVGSCAVATVVAMGLNVRWGSLWDEDVPERKLASQVAVQGFSLVTKYQARRALHTVYIGSRAVDVMSLVSGPVEWDLDENYSVPGGRIIATGDGAVGDVDCFITVTRLVSMTAKRDDFSLSVEQVAAVETGKMILVDIGLLVLTD